MEKQKKMRAVIRGMLTKGIRALNEAVSIAGTINVDLQLLYEVMCNHYVKLEELNKNILDLMLEGNFDEESIQIEVEKIEEYDKEFLRAKLIYVDKMNQRQQEHAKAPLKNEPCDHKEKSRKFKLPKIELKKYGGELREWLQFWSQFKKIHEDGDLDREDKFQYLIQCMITNSRASELVSSFPPTGENYEKAIESLRARFGKKEMLVEVYIRDLLQLVINNITKVNSEFRIAALYDKLECHLRALETLEITNENCAPLLFPLVESSLPEELLRAWQRFVNTSGTVEPKDRLSKILEFLRGEVDNEERISMAMKGFSLNNAESIDKAKKRIKNDNPNIATAASLFSGRMPLSCIFCEQKHENADCQKAKNVTLEERRKLVKDKNACFKCLKVGHSYRKCKKQLKCSRCDRRHTLLMCPELNVSSSMSVPINETDVKPSTSKDNGEDKVQNSLSNLTMNSGVFLQTLRVKLENKEQIRVVRAIIDSGSQRSYILKRLAEEMEYEPIKKQVMIHGLFGGMTSSPETHKKYFIHVKSLNDQYENSFTFFDKSVICNDIPCINNGPWIQELKKNNIILTDATNSDEQISLLIGSDILAKLVSKNIQYLQCGVTAVETKLGWTLLGDKPEYDYFSDNALLVTSLFTQECNVSDLWRLDVLGISDPVEIKSKERHQEEVKEIFSQTVTITEDGRYEVLLPWKEDHPPLKYNREMAVKRLEKVTRKLKDEGRLEAYDQIFKDWLEEGIIEIVNEEKNNEIGYYLPHRHVIRECSTTTPIRPVFDASARGRESPSLNQCLETGPNLIELIPRLLMRFRERKLGVISDIRKAFLQISIDPKERDVLRFLWYDETNPNSLQVFRHTRVVFGLTCSPFLLGATIDLHLERIIAETVAHKEKALLRQLQKSFYVDNSVTSVNSENELKEFQEKAIGTMLRAGFDLRAWEYTRDKETDHFSSVLGLKWDKLNDNLLLNETSLDVLKHEKITKRVILSVSHKIYDVLGIISPVLLYPKLLLRKLWTEELGWDTEINETDKKSFLHWYSQLKLLNEIRVPRWMFHCNGQVGSVTFHTFVDASKLAYAAVLFARVETEEGVDIHLIQANSRVAPMKSTTIPRLELLAATVGARLMNFTMKALEYEQCERFYWSDSTTVLTWIKRNSQWARFVWNRIQEIRQLSEPDQWHYIPSEYNYADLLSRGCDVKHFLESNWWKGPQWLKLSRQGWPKGDFTLNEAEINNEVRKSKDIKTLNVCVKEDTIWYSKYFSNYHKIIRMIGWICRFIYNSRHGKNDRIGGDLTVYEINEAENKLISIVQKETFIDHNDSKLSNLNSFTDDKGMIRVKSLVADRKDEYEFRYPVVLDPSHELVMKLIRYEHLKNNHTGVQTVLNKLREKYWLLRGRKAIRNITDKCVICRRYKAKKIEVQPPVLPENRVKDAAVFEVVGVDLAGPIYLKNGQKAWICLFTCAVYRAIHLELVSSLSAEDFLLALRRFVARRGKPAIVYSDNGSNFVSANNLLRKYSSEERIEWHFNPPSAAWWGGWWERLIRVVK